MEPLRRRGGLGDEVPILGEDNSPAVGAQHSRDLAQGLSVQAPQVSDPYLDAEGKVEMCIRDR